MRSGSTSAAEHAEAAHHRTACARPTSSSRWAAATPARCFPGKRYEDWELTDPAGSPIEVVRQVRDEIRRRVETLVERADPGGVRRAHRADEDRRMPTPCWRSTKPGSMRATRPSRPRPRRGRSSTGSSCPTIASSLSTTTAPSWVGSRPSPVSDRCVYAGVVEHSVYVAPVGSGRGVGRALLDALIASTEAAGIWTIQSGIFPENVASVALHRAAGFREVGHARTDRPTPRRVAGRPPARAAQPGVPVTATLATDLRHRPREAISDAGSRSGSRRRRHRAGLGPGSRLYQRGPDSCGPRAEPAARRSLGR